MGRLYDIAIDLIISSLEKDAKRILEECVNERTYEHQSMNLYDSYGYGIYLNGALKKSGFLSVSPNATIGKKWYGETLHGRKEIEQFLDDYSSSVLVECVIAAAMPYAEVLEAGGGGIKKKYKVISMSFKKLKKISKDYKGTVKVL